MRLSVIGLVYRKELRETLRDRRTLFVMIALPILLYPILMLGVTAVAAKRVKRLADQAHPVALQGKAPRLRAHLEADPAIRVVDVEDAAQAVRDERAQAGLVVEPGFEAAIEGGEPAPVEVLFSHAEERSLAARGALRKSLDAFREAVLAERLGDEALLRPLERTERDLSGISGASVFSSRVLGLFLVLMMLTASFYPAVDLGAGEKERGTLETLLVAPVGRAELVLGKYLTVLTISLVAAMLNLLAMGLTFSRLAAALPGGGSATFVLDLGGIAAMLALLLPLGALFSAASLALSSFARSYKEGMHYLTPLAVVVTPLALVAALPDVRLDAGLALMPVTGSVLLFRDLLLGKGQLLHGVLAFASSAGVAALLLRWCVNLYRREDILFRPAGSGGFRAIRAEAKRRGLPGGGEALLLFAVGLALLWLAGGRLLGRFGLVAGHVLNQTLVVAAPAVVLAAVLGFRMRATFRLRAGRPRVLVAAVLLGPALAVLLSELWARLGLAETEDARDFAKLMEGFLALPLGVRLLLLAVLPAVCEEVLFRGFVLTGLRRSGGPVRAALLCGLLFGLFHLSPSRIPVTAALGAVLAALALRGGGLLPAVLAHALYNGVLVGLDRLPPGLASTDGAGVYHPLVLVAAVLLVAAGALLLVAGDRRGREIEPPGDAAGFP